MNIFKAMKKETNVYHIITFSSLMREKVLVPIKCLVFCC
jgi:hypothetical protein